MPIYEYECPTHGRYEVTQRITEDALTTCAQPECAQPVRKLISQTSFALKGTGWYATDYSKSSSGAANTEKKDKPSEPATPCGKTECGSGGCAAA